MKDSGIVKATASLELSFGQMRSMVEQSELPIEVIVHGTYESMICDHNLPSMSLPHYHFLDNPELMQRHYALLDKTGEVHPIRIDQYGRSHIYFAKDLCLYPYLENFRGIASYRIEAQDYSAELVGRIVGIYREALNDLANGEEIFREEGFDELKKISPRALGIGTYRFRQSRNSI